MTADNHEQLVTTLQCPARLARALGDIPPQTLQQLAQAVDKTLEDERLQLEQAYRQALPGWLRPWVLRWLRREPA